MEFSRQEYWSGLPCPAPGDLLNLGTEPRSPALQVDSLPFEPPGKPQQRGWGAFHFVDMDTLGVGNLLKRRKLPYLERPKKGKENFN